MATPSTPPPAGLVLAAGAGRRYGGPKALARTSSGETWVRRAVALLREAGCGPVFVTTGASGDEVAAELDGLAEPVPVPDWELGMAASVGVGLAVIERGDSPAAVILLVDLPDVGSDVVSRILAHWAPGDEGVLIRAAYDGRPGHPVVIGRSHFAAALEGAGPDEGARRFLERAAVTLVECGDLATGHDLDHRAATD
jgi:CTP:molybdopterin cytidylyltransferase MocA